MNSEKLSTFIKRNKKDYIEQLSLKLFCKNASNKITTWKMRGAKRDRV